MNKRFTLILILLFCAVVSYNKVLAQDKVADSIQQRKISANMAGVFNSAVKEQSALYNGPAFIPYTFRTTTTANFRDTTDFYNGWVNYNGIVYTNVPLIYNMEKDALVSKLFNGVSLYTLLSDRVYDFNVLGHHFIRVWPDAANPQIEAGFYEDLYTNKIQVLARRTKEIQKEAISKGTGSFFAEKTDYFLKKGNKYYNVNSEGKFYDALKDKKKELKQFLKDNKLKFGDNTERVMAGLAAYYDHITN